MRANLHRFLSFVLAVALCVPLFLVSAPSASAFVYNPVPSDSFLSALNNLSGGFGYDFTDFVNGLELLTVGECTWEELKACKDDYNSYFGGLRRILSGSLWTALSNLYHGDSYAVLAYDEVNGIYRMKDTATGAWITTRLGEFPYVLKSDGNSFIENEETSSGAQDIYTGSGTANKFVRLSEITGRTDSNSSVIVTHDVLSAACLRLNDAGTSCSLMKTPWGKNSTQFWVIYRDTSEGRFYYCNSSGQPYLASIEPARVDQPQTVVDTQNNVLAENTQIIDMAEGVLNIVNENGEKKVLQIDQLNFNFDDHSYTVNAYDYTYNTENNFYEFNYYTYNISYTYNNTYITYLGSTAEYQPEEWALYYELPDGRSSADLTAAEIAGMSFEFYDVVNYAKSATDTSLRALYHFDGDTDDSSYFSTQGAFDWVKGSSITYMESNAFNGALYMDEREHEFKITLPSNIGAGDFTYQWRYYQNSAAVTTAHNDNYINIGGKKVLGWAENYLYNGSGTLLGNLSNGSWQELALIRHSGTLYFYHNGLCIGSVADNTGYSGEIVFHLGNTSRAYSMVDEMRFVNYALAENGAFYTCTSVPYDTNSVLVLPDSAFPIADEYWEFNTDGNQFPIYDFTTGTLSLSSYPTKGVWSGNSDTFFSYDGYSSIDCSTYSDGSYRGIQYWFRYSGSSTGFGPVDGANCLSILSSDGTVYSYPFTYSGSGSYRQDFDWGYLSLYRDSSNTSVSIMVAPGKVLDFIYVELVAGSTPNPGSRKVTCIYSSEEVQPNTAAIQSDIPVNGYTVGGVRPTFPVRGDVWFPVEGSRITGCYIYNGSAWESAGCRYYTGTRWIPIYAFDLTTMEDLWDISDKEEVTTAITSEYGFWNWWQKQWLDFRSWLAGVLGKGTGSTTVNPDDLPGEEGTEEGNDGWSFLDLLGAIKDGTWKIIKGIVGTVFGGLTGIVSAVTSIGNYFDAYDSNGTDNIFGIVDYGGSDIWD